MGVGIPIIGLPTKIKEIPDGTMMLLTGSMDAIPSFLAQAIGHLGWKRGRTVTYITSKSSNEVLQQVRRIEPEHIPFYIVERSKPDDWEDYISRGSVLIIDSFLFLSLETDTWVYKSILEDLRDKCKKLGAIIILVGSEGMLNDTKDYVLTHVSDGIMNFRSRDTDEGVTRFIRIPKWIDGEPIDLNIYYHFENNHINVDSRSRVI